MLGSSIEWLRLADRVKATVTEHLALKTVKPSEENVALVSKSVAEITSFNLEEFVNDFALFLINNERAQRFIDFDTHNLTSDGNVLEELQNQFEESNSFEICIVLTLYLQAKGFGDSQANNRFPTIQRIPFFAGFILMLEETVEKFLSGEQEVAATVFATAQIKLQNYGDHFRGLRPKEIARREKIALAAEAAIFRLM